jgi:hypothetical protein
MRIELKLALLAVLVAAALFTPAGFGSFYGFRLAVLLFGAVNIFVELPGTIRVRAGGFASAVLTLLWPSALLLLLVVLIWPPAFAVSWAIGQRPPATRAEEEAQEFETRRARLVVVAIITAVAVSAVVYRVIAYQGLQQTAALFIGIPAILAIMVVFMISPESATGVATKAVTVGLLVSMTLLGEGMLCVAMSAPLFYAVAIAIAALAGSVQRSGGEKATLHSMLFLLAVAPMTLEGVTGTLSFDRHETVAVTKIVAASPDQVGRALFESPRFDRVRPLYLRLGFPVPVSTLIAAADGRTTWVIRLRGGEMRLNGMEPRTGDLTLVLEESRPGLVRWRTVSDTSHTIHFLTWQAIAVEWKPSGDGTEVTWTLQYRRDLDPAWYFGPMERYAVQLAAGYLIDAVATP